MKHFARDFSVGLFIAVPVVALAGFGVHEMLELKRDNSALEARHLEAVREKDSAVKKLAGLQQPPQPSQPSAADHSREPAHIVDTRGASEEQLRQIIEFLKKELAASESALKEARDPSGGAAANGPGRGHESQLLGEISRLNNEIEQLREERDRWKKAAEKP